MELQLNPEITDAVKEACAIETMHCMVRQYAADNRISFEDAFFTFANSSLPIRSCLISRLQYGKRDRSIYEASLKELLQNNQRISLYNEQLQINFWSGSLLACNSYLYFSRKHISYTEHPLSYSKRKWVLLIHHRNHHQRNNHSVHQNQEILLTSC